MQCLPTLIFCSILTLSVATLPGIPSSGVATSGNPGTDVTNMLGIANSFSALNGSSTPLTAAYQQLSDAMKGFAARDASAALPAYNSSSNSTSCNVNRLDNWLSAFSRQLGNSSAGQRLQNAIALIRVDLGVKSGLISKVVELTRNDFGNSAAKWNTTIEGVVGLIGAVIRGPLELASDTLRAQLEALIILIESGNAQLKALVAAALAGLGDSVVTLKALLEKMLSGVQGTLQVLIGSLLKLVGGLPLAILGLLDVALRGLLASLGTLVGGIGVLGGGVGGSFTIG